MCKVTGNPKHLVTNARFISDSRIFTLQIVSVNIYNASPIYLEFIFDNNHTVPVTLQSTYNHKPFKPSLPFPKKCSCIYML